MFKNIDKRINVYICKIIPATAIAAIVLSAVQLYAWDAWDDSKVTVTDYCGSQAHTHVAVKGEYRSDPSDFDHVYSEGQRSYSGDFSPSPSSPYIWLKLVLYNPYRAYYVYSSGNYVARGGQDATTAKAKSWWPAQHSGECLPIGDYIIDSGWARIDA